MAGYRCSILVASLTALKLVSTQVGVQTEVEPDYGSNALEDRVNAVLQPSDFGLPRLTDLRRHFARRRAAAFGVATVRGPIIGFGRARLACCNGFERGPFRQPRLYFNACLDARSTFGRKRIEAVE